MGHSFTRLSRTAIEVSGVSYWIPTRPSDCNQNRGHTSITVRDNRATPSEDIRPRFTVAEVLLTIQLSYMVKKTEQLFYFTTVQVWCLRNLL